MRRTYSLIVERRGVFLFAVWVLVLSSQGWSGQEYSIQVGAYPTEEEAQAAEATFSMSCAPVFTVHDDSGSAYPYKVLVGRFANRVDAWIGRSALRKGGAPDCFIRRQDWATSASEANRLLMTLPFSTAGAAGADLPSASEYWNAAGLAAPDAAEIDSVGATLIARDPTTMTREELLTVGTSPGADDDEALPALERFISVYPTDALINRVRLCLARRLGERGDRDRALTLVALAKAAGTESEQTMGDFVLADILHGDKKETESFAAFQRVANNELAPPSLRRAAMSKGASVAHAARKYPTAWLSLKQLEEASPDGAALADARMRRSGLAFELVSAGKSDWEQVREMLESVRGMEGATTQTLATASLMHLETWYHEGKLDRALAECNALCSAFPSVPREYEMAVVWKGVILCDLQRYDDAEICLKSFLDRPEQRYEAFRGINVRAKALYWLAWMANQRGDVEERDQYVVLLQKTYPAARETQKATTMFPAASP